LFQLLLATGKLVDKMLAFDFPHCHHLLSFLKRKLGLDFLLDGWQMDNNSHKKAA